MRTLISNGTVVTAEGSQAADVLIDGETIAAIGADLAGAGISVDETIDAAGKYVIPGAIDVHTHMELPFGGTMASDDFETGTIAAAFGGTTSIVDFAVQGFGERLVCMGHGTLTSAGSMKSRHVWSRWRGVRRRLPAGGNRAVRPPRSVEGKRRKGEASGTGSPESGSAGPALRTLGRRAERTRSGPRQVGDAVALANKP